MELKASIQKPYTSQQRTDFIVNYNTIITVLCQSLFPHVMFPMRKKECAYALFTRERNHVVIFLSASCASRGIMTAAAIYARIPDPPKTEKTAKPSLTNVASMPKYSAIPPHTPQIILSVSLLQSFFISLSSISIVLHKLCSCPLFMAKVYVMKIKRKGKSD